MEKQVAETVQTLKAHLAMNVENVERSIDFYRKMFGIEPSKVRAGYAKFNVENPPLNLTLNERPGVRRGAISHLGVQVAATDDVLKMREKWRAAGLAPRDEMQTNCCYALQDKSWVRDPDGNEWEVFVVLEDNLLETSACCTPEVTANNVAATTGETEAAASCAQPSTHAVPATRATAEASSCCTPEATAPVQLAR